MLSRIRQILLTFTLIVGIGCGGGTRGSGGQLYDGFIGDESLRALEGVNVTIAQSGDSGVSDQDGRFTIKTETLSGKLTLLIEGSGISTQLETTEVPADAIRVELTIKIPSGGKPGASASIEVRERKTARPTPSKTPDDSNDSSRGEDGDDSDDRDNDDDSDNDSDDDSRDDNSGSGRGGSGDDSGGSNGGSGGSDGDDSDDDDDSDSDSPKDGEKRDVEGAISSLSGSSVVVSGVEFNVTSSSEFRDVNGDKITLNGFKVGASARARGVYQSGKLLLERLQAR